MKLTALLTFLIAALGPITDGETVTKSIDVSSSVITWKGYKVTGEHTGTVQLASGELKMTDGVLTGGQFTVKMNSITCTDLEGEWRDKLVGHLNSKDFFNTEKYPTATLEITRAIPQDTKGNYKVLGNLTIKEKTKPVKFFATVEGNTATAKLEIDRSEYDVRYGSGSFFDNLGDKTIYDEFDLEIKLAIK